jgi:hypothetical protein
VDRLFEIASKLQTAHKAHETRLGGRVPEDSRDAANLMLALRGAKFGHSAVDDFHFNPPAAGAAMGRSLLETAITLRWCLSSADNGTRWWREGDAAVQKTLKALATSDEPSVVAVRDGTTVGIGLPNVQKMAKIAGMESIHSMWYPVLSSHSHPSRMSTGHSYARPSSPLPPLITPCIYSLTEIGTVFSAWAANRELPALWPHP